MTERWFRAGDFERNRARSTDFDPVAEGARYGLSPDVSRAIWARVCREATDGDGRLDELEARRRFQQVAERVAARGGRLQPDPGRRTRVEAEAAGLDPAGDVAAMGHRLQPAPGRRTRVEAEAARHDPAGDVFAEPVPGKTTQVEVNARRWEQRSAASGSLPEETARRWQQQIVASGSPSELPFRPTLEQLFGTHLGSVRAYVGQGGPLAQQNVHAAAWRETVAFAGPLSLPLVAHEVAHVLQLRAGTPDRAFSRVQDDAEREADAVAHAVARGARRVSVQAAPAAAVSFSPDPGPAPASVAATWRPALLEAIQRAHHERRRFGDAFARTPSVAAQIGRSHPDAPGGHPAVLRDALAAGAALVGGFGGAIATKGQRDPTRVTLDDLLRLLGDVFDSPELEAAGLPASFGDRVALDPVLDELEAAFDDAQRAATASSDARAIHDEVITALTGHRAMIEAAIEQIAGSWHGPMDLVDLELKGAIGHLVELRGELAGAASPAQQAALGGPIAHLARYVLLLSDRLGDPGSRIQRAIQHPPAAPFDALRGAAATLTAARAPIRSEQATLEALGNASDLLGERRATAIDPATATPVSEVVRPEEAFAHHTDQLMAQSQQEVAWQAARQERELALRRSELAPRGIRLHAQFVPVYERWFGFFSRAVREDQDGAFMQVYIAATSLMPMAGTAGYAARVGAQMAVSSAFTSSGASDDFAREAEAIPLVRTTSVEGDATRNGDPDVRYRFQDEARGHADGGERASRDGAVNERMAQRSAAIDDVYRAAPGGARDAAVVQGGLAPGPTPGARPPRLALYPEADHRDGRDGARTGWSYLLIASIGEATGKLEQVYEHKVMREDVARYLLAAAQHLQTLMQPHEIRDPRRADAPRLGDASGRAGDVMGSTASAAAIYGQPGDRGAHDASLAARGAFEAQKRRALHGVARHDAMAAATRELRLDLERSLDEFFSAADGKDKLQAIILDIAVKEHCLDAAIWKHVEPEALWEFARQAIYMAAAFWALERLGPAGHAASALVQRALATQYQRQLLSAAMAFAAWLDGATSARSFREAQGWAFTFVPLADGFAQAVRDWAAQKLGHGLTRKIGDAYTTARSEPRTVGELRRQLEPMLADARVRREVVHKMETELTARLQHGKPPTAEDQTQLALLFAVDPDAHARIATRFGQVPRLTETTPLTSDPTLSVHTPLHLVAFEAEVRKHIDERLGRGQTIQPYRVEVLTPAEFERRFQSAKGRSMVTTVEEGRAVVYARADAGPRDFADEAIHLLQLNDPKAPEIAADIRMLGEATLGHWHKFDVELRKQLFERKLSVEIDAKQRRLAELTVTDPEWRPIHDELANLQALETRSRSITDDQLLAMRAGGKRPAFLDDPAWLFAKQTTTVVNARLDVPGVDLSKLSTRVVTDSPAVKFGTVKQIGEPWTTVTVVFATNEGKVKLEPHAVNVNGRRYLLEDGAALHVRKGDSVQPGQMLAIEPAAQYRLVEVRRHDGTTDQRTEYFSRKRGNRWVQAGEHSTRRGERVAKAARNQLHEELTAEKQAAADPRNAASRDPNRLVEFVRVDNQTPHGGGFDDVLIELRGDPPTALIRIIEIKDYPYSSVSMAEMTAIRENLGVNLDRLRQEVRTAARTGAPDKRPAPFRNLTTAQLQALGEAVDANNFRIELRLGPSTKIGAENHSSATILSRLRDELKTSGWFGDRDVLDKEPPRQVDQKAIDAVPE